MRFRNQRPFEGKPWIPYADRPAYGEKLADTNCINCGQCVQVCPTGALTVHYHTYGLYRQKELGKN